MAYGTIVALAVAALAAASPLKRDSQYVVDLGYVKYSGAANPNTSVVSWQGIRYAASPEGALRWRPPVDIEKKNNYSGQLIDATSAGPQCLQGNPAWDPESQDPNPTEDCLLLNVRRPANPVSSKLAVVFEIHGGGYTRGSAQSLEQIVSMSNGTVMSVEIQYRLGGLGFLDGSAVRKHGTPNAGLLDQRSALHWVQRNIAAFGGDPTKVTMNGGSAGGGSVSAQLQLYGGETTPPFRGAMADFPWWQNFHQDSILEKQYQLLLKATNASNLHALRQLPFAQLANGISQSYNDGYAAQLYGYGDYFYGPTVDGSIIKELPSQAFSAGRFSKVPFWVDHDALEGLTFSNDSIDSAAELRSDLKQLWPAANASFLDTLDQLYPTQSFNGTAYFDQPIIAATAPNTTLGKFLAIEHPKLTTDYGVDPYFYKRQQIFGDAYVGCGTATMARSLAAYGVPVWKTIWNTGALVHGTILIPLFGDAALGLPPNPFAGTPDQQRDLIDYFIAFVTDLDPNAASRKTQGGRPNWPQYGNNTNVLEFNMTTTGVTKDPDSSDRCKFIYDHPLVVRN